MPRKSNWKENAYSDREYNEGRGVLNERLPPGFERNFLDSYSTETNIYYSGPATVSVEPNSNKINYYDQNHRIIEPQNYELPPHLYISGNSDRLQKKDYRDDIKYQSIKNFPPPQSPSYINKSYPSQVPPHLQANYEAKCESGLILPDIELSKFSKTNVKSIKNEEGMVKDMKNLSMFAPMKECKSPETKRCRRQVSRKNRRRSLTPIFDIDSNGGDKTIIKEISKNQITQKMIFKPEEDDKCNVEKKRMQESMLINKNTINDDDQEIFDSSEYCFVSLRYLLAEEMCAAIDNNIECGILEDFVVFEYMKKFSRPLKFIELGFTSLDSMIEAKCSDIAKKDYLQQGRNIRVIYKPTLSFREARRIMLERLKNEYMKLLLVNKENQKDKKENVMCRRWNDVLINDNCAATSEALICKQENTNSANYSFDYNTQNQSSALQPQNSSKPNYSEVKKASLAPFVLVKMAKKLLRSLMQDIFKGKAGPLTIQTFLEKFKGTYGCKLDPSDVGFDDVVDFLNGAKIEDIANIKVFEGEKFLLPSVKFYKDQLDIGEVMAGSISMNQSQNNETEVLNEIKERQERLLKEALSNPLHSQQESYENFKETNIVSKNKKSIKGLGKNNEKTKNNDLSHINCIPNRNNIIGGVTSMELSALEKIPNNSIINTASGMKLLMKIPDNTILSGTQEHIQIPQLYYPMFSQTKDASGAEGMENRENTVSVGGEEEVDFNKFDAEVLDKLRDLLKKHVIIPDAQIPISRLPLIFCQEYKKVLNYQKYGYSSLNDLLMLLEDIVIIEDSPKGKVLVSAKRKLYDPVLKNKEMAQHKSLHMATPSGNGYQSLKRSYAGDLSSAMAKKPMDSNRSNYLYPFNYSRNNYGHMQNYNVSSRSNGASVNEKPQQMTINAAISTAGQEVQEDKQNSKNQKNTNIDMSVSNSLTEAMYNAVASQLSPYSYQQIYYPSPYRYYSQQKDNSSNNGAIMAATSIAQDQMIEHVMPMSDYYSYMQAYNGTPLNWNYWNLANISASQDYATPNPLLPASQAQIVSSALPVIDLTQREKPF